MKRKFVKLSVGYTARVSKEIYLDSSELLTECEMHDNIPAINEMDIDDLDDLILEQEIVEMHCVPNTKFGHDAVEIGARVYWDCEVVDPDNLCNVGKITDIVRGWASVIDLDGEELWIRLEDLTKL